MACISNPYYGGGTENDYTFDITPYWDSVTGRPCNPGAGDNTRIPQIIATPGGITSNNNKLDSVLSSILSGLALLKGAKQVPTTVSGELPPTVIYQGASGGIGAGAGSGGNIAGQIQNLVQKNPGAVLIGTVVIVALFLKPPTKK